MPARRVVRDINEDARDVARGLAKSEAFEQSCRDRKPVQILFAHLKRILRLGRLRLRGPRGAQFEFTLAATAQNLRRLGKLGARFAARGHRVRCVRAGSRASSRSSRWSEWQKGAALAAPANLIADFCNKIGTNQTSAAVLRTARIGVGCFSCAPWRLWHGQRG